MLPYQPEIFLYFYMAFFFSFLFCSCLFSGYFERKGQGSCFQYVTVVWSLSAVDDNSSHVFAAKSIYLKLEFDSLCFT